MSVNSKSKVFYYSIIIFIILSGSFLLESCAPLGEAVQVTTLSQDTLKGVGEKELDKIAELTEGREENEDDIKSVIKGTANYTVAEYLSRNPDANNPSSRDFSVGGNDVMNITVYEEPDLSRENIRVSADGYISFPFINRVKVEGLTSSEIEERISTKLAEGQYLLNAHVSVSVQEFNSKQYLVLGSVKNPGSYPLQGNDRVLDAISRTGGIDFEQGGKQAMIVRTENPGTDEEEKIVIRIELGGLLKGGDQRSNLLLADNDLLYIPKAENFYILGQVKNPGSYPYLEKDITLVEAISKAGGFTPIAARNRTRIIRIEEGVEKVIQVKVDVITQAGRKAQDILIQPGDVIVIPESFF